MPLKDFYVGGRVCVCGGRGFPCACVRPSSTCSPYCAFTFLGPPTSLPTLHTQLIQNTHVCTHTHKHTQYTHTYVCVCQKREECEKETELFTGGRKCKKICNYHYLKSLE